jgi:hypothetical protein
MTLSENPMINGIQVSIGGGGTILLAADQTETAVDEQGQEVLVHYPGKFSSTLNLSAYENYDYLKSVTGLAPVSTSDGIHWILPTYSKETGNLKDITDFSVDTKLAYANRTEEGTGSYVYFDLWVVSPGSEYKVRAAMDTKSQEGSYLLEAPDEKFETDGRIESQARVGFLVNADVGSTAAMTAYTKSTDFDSRYKSLKGLYQEPGSRSGIDREYNFSIYEPNATLHPALEGQDGSYLITNPLAMVDGTIQETDIADRLMVQTKSSWQTQNFVSSGEFYQSTAALYEAAADGVVSAEKLSTAVTTAGATDDVNITELERNTPQRIRIYIWLEGQDADCMNTTSVSASSISLSIELSGATQ